MRTQITLVTLMIALCLSLPHLSLAAEPEHRASPVVGTALELSPGLKTLLNQEMELIQQGMMNLVAAMAAGHWDEILATGMAIQNSFILKQKLSAVQFEELHRVLPPEFVVLDQAFHHDAGVLAHAAEKRNADVMNVYFAKLNEACVTCHAKFATQRFPGFIKPPAKDAHHH